MSSQGTHDALISYLKSEVGDSLRSVVRYSGDGDDVLFLRDDVTGDLDAGVTINEIIEREVDDVFGEVGRDYLEDLYKLGKHRCSIEVFEEGCLLMVMFGPNESVFVSTDNKNDADLAMLGRHIVDVGPEGL